MNAARLTRRWQEAAGDPARMAEALVDEINDPATGLVTRDFLRAELAQLRGEIAQLRETDAFLYNHAFPHTNAASHGDGHPDAASHAFPDPRPVPGLDD